jgi:cytochrome c biogenesis protein CcmG, thiol:disulfide interchange protein DsbE
MDLRRRHPVVLAGGAIVVGLVAAVLAAVVYTAVVDDDPDVPKVEAELSFGPEDREPANQGLIGRDVSGDPVPTSTFTKLGGGLGRLTDYRGKPLVVNFFGSWCVPCRKEIPALESVYKELGGKVAFLGLAIHDSERSAQAFVEERGVTYEVGRDPSDKLFTDMGVVIMPSTFLISADGRIVEKHSGALTAGKLRSLLEEKLGVS